MNEPNTTIATAKPAIGSVSAAGYQKFIHRKLGKIYVPVLLVDGRTKRHSHRWHKRASDALSYGQRLASRFAAIKTVMQ